ncbi:MAG: hypothetical protein KAY49_01750, partial [Aeromonas sp.]|nr:hypothetical protein [Aeromonas sp.]
MSRFAAITIDQPGARGRRATIKKEAIRPLFGLSMNSYRSSTTGALAIHLGQQFLADTDGL